MKLKQMPLPFTKLHGLGNDFVLINSLPGGSAEGVTLTPAQIRLIADRHFGVGCDQLIQLLQARDPKHAAQAVFYNQDGSRVEMCGNGIRAVALHLTHGAPTPRTLQIETEGGLQTVWVDPTLKIARVTLPPPTLQSPKGGEILILTGHTAPLRFWEIGMGNPHAVIFVENTQQVTQLVNTLGPLIEKHSRFPNRVNAEFVFPTGPHTLQVAVWERGAGATLACGTGACAAVVASLWLGHITPDPNTQTVTVHLPGGALQIAWAGGTQDTVRLTGPATRVFSGEIAI